MTEYEEEERQRRMGSLASLLEEKDSDLVTALITFCIFGLNEENTKFRLASGDKQDVIVDLLPKVVYQWINALEKFDPNDFLQAPDKDLYFIIEQWVNDISESEEIVADEAMKEIIRCALSATFRMWYNQISVSDVIAYFKGNKLKDTPSLIDSSINYLWAQESGIHCSDYRSLFENPSGIKHELNDQGLDALVDIEREFKKMVESISKFDGVDSTFIEENYNDCKTVYMLTLLFDKIMPIGTSLSDLIKKVGLEKSYRIVFGELAGPQIKDKVLDETKIKGFFVIFQITVMLLETEREKDPADHVARQTSFFKAASQSRANFEKGD